MGLAREFFVVNLLYSNAFTDEFESTILFVSSDEDEAYSKYIKLQEEKGYGVSKLHTALEFLVFELSKFMFEEEVKKYPTILYSKDQKNSFLDETTGIFIKDSDWYYSEVDRLNPTIKAHRERKVGFNHIKNIFG